MTGDPRNLRALRAWLLCLWVGVWLMVVIGGVTRLTGSGLSIVEWRPVTGALPPLSHHAWQQAFDAYQRSPQYRVDNQWMTLADFQRIFFWEYVHRLWGRLLGVACLLPWLWLWRSGRIDAAQARRTASILLLGGLQAAAGWYMVRSGLVNEPRVSHYRLALHLLLGMGVGQWILWQALDADGATLASSAAAASERSPRATRGDRMWVAGLLPLLALQVVYGAFMAGMHAGYLSSTFPDMNGHYLPAAFFVSGSVWRAAVSSALAIHYLHRALALVVTAYVVMLAYRLRTAPRRQRVAAFAVLGAAGLQVLLGVLTVVWRVPLPMAAAHQAGGYLLVSAAVMLCHSVWSSVEAEDGDQARNRDGGFAGTRQDLRRA